MALTVLYVPNWCRADHLDEFEGGGDGGVALNEREDCHTVDFEPSMSSQPASHD